ncbi:nuclear transport factor 2 family protein [Hoeflea alexandrii]|uniref:nuclear transport factor 2 family protein n=1 Tax=Hoeflea alexandrii TaxID=288436 RepID=UPI0022AF8736|nr:nuclear transport factor 2 family protein [Hoeflea alexandrii]MCZ4291724.1 nuclear transport factor 2 family protein [Hoeflea alexandrii]
MNTSEAADILEISQLIQSWGFFRDQGRWAELARTFVPGGTISVTWFTGVIDDFVAASQKQYKAVSPRTKHLIGVPVAKVLGVRAIAETNIQILGRFEASDVTVDVTSYARFADRLIRTKDGWRIARRDAVYEKDRMDPVAPGTAFDRFMAETDFSAIPEPYRYLGYRLITSGRTLHSGIICDGSAEADRLLADADLWLAEG